MSTDQILNMPMSSAAECPANPPVQPENEKVRKTAVGSGLKLFASYDSTSRHGASLKMCVGLLLLNPAWSSTICLLSWKTATTKCKHSLFQLVPSMPRTDEIGCGLWPTASTRDWKDTPGMAQEATDKSGKYRNRIDQLARMVYAVERKMWPTPQARDGAHNRSALPNQRSLPNEVALYPTPTANRRDGLQSHGVNVVSGSLNPAWVEWLMGFPVGWAACGVSATRSFRKSSKSSDVQ